MLWLALQYLPCIFEVSLGLSLGSVRATCLHAMSLRCYGPPASGIHKLVHRSKILCWKPAGGQATQNTLAFPSLAFGLLWACESGSKPISVFLMSAFKTEAASSPPGSKNNLRMSLYGTAHLWNFSPLKWGIFELGLLWEQFLRRSSYGETSPIAAWVSGGMAAVLTLPSFLS